jgi:hypothetical protein
VGACANRKEAVHALVVGRAKGSHVETDGERRSHGRIAAVERARPSHVVLGHIDAQFELEVDFAAHGLLVPSGQRVPLVERTVAVEVAQGQHHLALEVVVQRAVLEAHHLQLDVLLFAARRELTARAQQPTVNITFFEPQPRS